MSILPLHLIAPRALRELGSGMTILDPEPPPYDKTLLLSLEYRTSDLPADDPPTCRHQRKMPILPLHLIAPRALRALGLGMNIRGNFRDSRRVAPDVRDVRSLWTGRSRGSRLVPRPDGGRRVGTVWEDGTRWGDTGRFSEVEEYWSGWAVWEVWGEMLVRYEES